MSRQLGWTATVCASMRRTIRPITQALLLAVTGSLAAFSVALTSTAQAAEFHVWGCSTPSGAPALTDGWQPAASSSSSGNDAQGTTQTNSCALGGPLRLQAGTDTAVGPGPGADGTSTAALQFAAPGGLHVRSVTLRRALLVASGGARYAAVNVDRALSGDWARVDQLVLFQSSNRLTLGSAAAGDAASVSQFAPLSTSQGASVRAEVYCQYWSYPSLMCRAQFDLFASDIVLDDPSAPRLRSIASRFTDAAGAVQPGAQLSDDVAIALSADDEGSGVRHATLVVDGQPVASADAVGIETERAKCAPSEIAADGRPAYQLRVPCPRQAALALTWNTRNHPDGPRDVQLLLSDAAGNTTTVASGRVMVRNSPAAPAQPETIGPGSPLSERGDRNGNTDTDDAQLTIVWPKTERAPSRTPAVRRRCQRNERWARQHPRQCQGTPASRRLVRRWSRTVTETLSGQLAGPQGPIANAEIALFAIAASATARAEPLSTVRTDAQGRFSLPIRRADGSRTIRAAWFSRSRDTVASADATAELVVSGATSIRAATAVRPGQDVTFSGELLGQAGTRSRVPITLEVKYRGRWRTFATSSTDDSGRWSRRVRRFATAPGRYEVRARTGVSAVYPFAAGTSTRTVAIRVRPPAARDS